VKQGVAVDQATVCTVGRRSPSRIGRLAALVREHPPAVASAAAWALRARYRTRRGLSREAFKRSDVPRVPSAPADAELAVRAVLKATRSTCLTGSIVRQHWLAAQGDERDLVIGVSRAAGDFRAHAWLVGDPPSTYAGYTEILRRAPSDELTSPIPEAAFD
jgi:hypothetical protein